MKIVQIGAGSWGEKNLEILSCLGILSAVYETDPARLGKLEKKYSVKSYESIDEIFSSKDFDAACIDSRILNSKELVIKLLDENKHVFIENPCIFDSQELGKLKEITQKKKLIFTFSSVDRFNPITDHVKKITKEENGELVALEWYREFPLSENINGIIFQSSIYDIDVTNWIFGELPVVVFAKVFSNERDILASIMLGYKNNKNAIILSNGLSKKTSVNLRVISSRDSIEVDFNTNENNKKLEKNNIAKVNESMLSQLENFMKAIERKNNLSTTPNDMINVVRIAEASLLSSKNGVPIYLDLK